MAFYLDASGHNGHAYGTRAEAEAEQRLLAAVLGVRCNVVACPGRRLLAALPSARPLPSAPAAPAAERLPSADDTRKQQRTLEAVEALQSAGTPVTFAPVSRAAGAPLWSVYSTRPVRAVIEHAMRDRTPPSGPHSTSRPRCDDLPTTPSAPTPATRSAACATSASDRADGCQRELGAQIDQLGHKEAIAGVQELERQNDALQAELAAARTEAAETDRQLAAAHGELAGARVALRRMMRERNTAASTTPGSVIPDRRMLLRLGRG